MFDTALAEILSTKEVNGVRMYYVHYIDCKCTLIICVWIKK